MWASALSDAEAKRLKMFLAVLAKRGILSCSFEGDRSSSELILECTAAEESGVLEIGNKHIFVNKNKVGFGNKRRACELKLYVRRRSCLSEDAISKLSLSDDKIGELGFYPDCEGKDFPSRPASLEAFVFISDQLFENIANVLQTGRKTESIFLDIEKKGTLEFGWEPDGSRMIWKLEGVAEPCYVDVTKLEIRLSLFG